MRISTISNSNFTNIKQNYQTKQSFKGIELECFEEGSRRIHQQNPGRLKEQLRLIDSKATEKSILTLYQQLLQLVSSENKTKLIEALKQFGHSLPFEDASEAILNALKNIK